MKAKNERKNKDNLLINELDFLFVTTYGYRAGTEHFELLSDTEILEIDI